MLKVYLRVAIAMWCLAAGCTVFGAGVAGEGRLQLVEAVPRDDLAATVGVSISGDGKFVYAASWQAATATVFARDGRSGKLEHKQTVSDDLLAGATTLSLSPDGRLAIASAFEAKTAVLYLRDAATGELTQSDVASDGDRGVRFQWPIDAAFSPDSKFAYVLDDHGPGPGGRGCVVTLRIKDGKLEH